MTLIFGINLCDRIYVSGDTRMSQKAANGDLVQKKDRIIKLAYPTPMLIAAFAANAKMSSFMAKKLKDTLPKDLDVRTFYASAEAIIAPLANEYWEQHDPTASITIIFGGINPNNRKELNWPDIHNKVMAYSKKRSNNSNLSMNLKPPLFNAMLKHQGEKLRYPEPSDSLVFSVQIYPPNKLIIEKAEWGEYLAYGPNGLTKQDVDEEIFGRIEFDMGNESKDNISISAILGSLAKKRSEESISETFFNAVITEKMQGAITGGMYRLNTTTRKAEFLSEIRQIGQKFYSREKDGSLRRLTFISDYTDFGDLRLSL